MLFIFNYVIFFFNLFFFSFSISLFFFPSKSYINKNIDEIYSENKSHLLYSEYNKPSLSSINETILFSYYSYLIKNYSTEEDLKYKKNPLITVIIPVYNGENFLLRSLLSIESQSFKNFEIIYIDDLSTDNSNKIIYIFQLIDKRIKIIKNKENKGTLYSKCFGVLNANGKYILVMDQDDIYIDKELFKNLIEIAENYSLDIIQFRFNEYFSNSHFIKFNTNKNYPNFYSIITQPELGNTELYLNEKLYKTFCLWDKLIKREIYLKAINFLDEKIWKKKIIHREDHIATFALYKMAKRYMRIKMYGYSHIFRENQETQFYFKIIDGKNVPQIKKEEMLRDQFEFFKFIYDRTNENLIEKNIAFRELLSIISNLNFVSFVKNKYYRQLIIEVIKIYLNSTFLNSEKKKIILKFFKIFYEKNFKIENKFNFNKIKNLFIQ